MRANCESDRDPLSVESFGGSSPTVFTNIYQDDVNMSIWRRNLSKELTEAAEEILETKPFLQESRIVTAENVGGIVNDLLGASAFAEVLSQDISELVDIFCCLFDLEEAGLKLSVLDHVMCPRFHVDWVPCRLLTTYHGEATQWLPHHVVDRSKLGSGNQGLPDERSGIFGCLEDVQQLNPGDVAILKGENWVGNEGAGLVHRSPQLSKSERRLLVSLDFTKI